MNPTILVCVLVISTYAEEGKLPSNFKKCNRNHADFNECLSIAAKDAIKHLTQPIVELGVPRLEPLDVPGMSVGDKVFAHIFDDAKIYGLSKPESLKFEIDLDQNTGLLEVNIPEVTLQGEFEVGGELAGKPVAGKGLGSVIVGNLRGVQKFTFKETTEVDGKKHLRIDTTKLSLYLGSLKVELEKAIDVDQATADEVVKHINDNWDEAFQHTRKGYEDLFGSVIYAIFDNILEEVPLDELFEQ